VEQGDELGPLQSGVIPECRLEEDRVRRSGSLLICASSGKQRVSKPSLTESEEHMSRRAGTTQSIRLLPTWHMLLKSRGDAASPSSKSSDCREDRTTMRYRSPLFSKGTA
jgi:hypothetical protein